jgi:hypothetical protein
MKLEKLLELYQQEKPQLIVVSLIVLRLDATFFKMGIELNTLLSKQWQTLKTHQANGRFAFA